MTEKIKKPGRKPQNIRFQNKMVLLELYHQYKELSVTEISKLAGLSRTTVMKVNHNLLNEDLIIETGKRQSTELGGKKPLIYQFNNRKNLIIAFYILYERIELRVFDLNYNILVANSASMKKSSKFLHIVKIIQGMISRWINENDDLKGAEFLTCIIGLHGNIDHNTGVCLQATHFHSWGVNRNIGQILMEKLELSCPIYVDNWIRLKTYGENRLGLVGQHESVVLLDTGWHGVAAGIMMNGKLFHGKHFTSGEVGHIRVNLDDQEECFCGSRGCFEKQIMIERLRVQAKELAKTYDMSLLADKTETLDIFTIFKAADAGDVIACKLMDLSVHWFSQVIANILLFFDPEVLYIEGDYAHGCKYFEDGLADKLNTIVLPRIKKHSTVIRYKQNEVDAVLHGAAVFAYDKFFISALKPRV
ncbi:MAG: ROK family transcriptional regulator [Spirochaetales bacterium]|nr:ROK family transcriptional regulator [Spirochaetales bacterium]